MIVFKISSICEICASLDGLPLAIELAAARSKLLSQEAMCARLESRLMILTGGARDLPLRSQTLRVAIDWGYELLEPDERRADQRNGRPPPYGVSTGGLRIPIGGYGCESSTR